MEFEQLVKIFFAEQATKADLVSTIEGIRRDFVATVAATAHVPHEYLESRGEYIDRLPWLVLVGKFLDEMDQAVDRWTRWAADVVADWPDDLTEAVPPWSDLEEIARNADTIIADG